MLHLRATAICAALSIAAGAGAAAANRTPTFEASIVSAANKPAGMARFIAVAGGGTQVTVRVNGLAPGPHAIHFHEIGSCNDRRDTSGKAIRFGEAGGYYNDAAMKADIPLLTVDSTGNGGLTFFSRALNVTGSDSVVGKAIVIQDLPMAMMMDSSAMAGAAMPATTAMSPSAMSMTPADYPRIACGEIGAVVAR